MERARPAEGGKRENKSEERTQMRAAGKRVQTHADACGKQLCTGVCEHKNEQHAQWKWRVEGRKQTWMTRDKKGTWATKDLDDGRRR
jgi:hypothetical protein